MNNRTGGSRRDQWRRWTAILCAGGVLLFAPACAAAATPSAAGQHATQAWAPEATRAAAEADTVSPAMPTQLGTLPPAATPEAPAALSTATPAARNTAPWDVEPTAVFATTTQPEIREERILELEWPPRMRLGDSDTLRLSLIPSEAGYELRAEFPEHMAQNSALSIARMEGYALWVSARLDGTGFDLAPEGEQLRELVPDLPATWRWTLTPRSAGRQRLSLTVLLRWLPLDPAAGAPREREAYSRALTVEVTSFLGLTAPVAAAAGLAGLGIGGAFSLPLAAYILRPRKGGLRRLSPNKALALEAQAGLALDDGERNLLRALFRSYARITLEAEFRSGYSGARTFLVLPVRTDGRTDAYTIAKLGEEAAIRREFRNYETFVKDTLPPITARIQEEPVTASDVPHAGSPSQAALRYTFIGEPGRKPVSLRQALTANPDPALLERLFDTFGPGWWMQRRPYVFRAAQEYDRALPAHFALEPASGRAVDVLDGRTPPDSADFPVGTLVRLRNFSVRERRAGGVDWTLEGGPAPGYPCMRARWAGGSFADGVLARITATRGTMLAGLAAGNGLCGLPDPLVRLPELLAERVHGTQSILHGDLNLENILAGPGGTVWLIDFARTREGHTLADFAHLRAELVAHLLAPVVETEQVYVDVLAGRMPAPPAFQLLAALDDIAARCLFNPSVVREYQLACALCAVGAMKYTNLDARQRRLLLLTAGWFCAALS